MIRFYLLTQQILLQFLVWPESGVPESDILISLVVFALGIYGVTSRKSLTIFHYETVKEEPISKFNFFAVSKPIQILEYCIPIGLHSDKN